MGEEERTVDFHGVMVSEKTALALTYDQLFFGAAYLKKDGTRIPAWKMAGFKSNPIAVLEGDYE